MMIRCARPDSLASPWPLVLLGIAAVIGLPSARAADTPEPPPPRAAAAVDPMKQAREAIAAKRWGDARAALLRANAPANADWQNLMGYVSRKQSPPDLDAAQRHYDEALRIDPNHRGALEYSGELDLQRGRLPQAEAKLARLQALCSSPCEPLDDLRAAIAAFKAGQLQPGAKR